ncbi:DUF6285 domain-containing protein [Pollutimonas thiosulfatoxidans]|uniref:DUF6285 domain-containing protein n=1 Tax=Pollutimonas thiosulfatoxidans TaxID=2028345 RepID=A0A410G8V7_9BURK|nr:DUF6285 domain-containing protein [Pollutimonas thiosulfatoxidans]QAA92706.1 hypothetical protein CKA81_01735 [Pollutimonas thiosulfatoxidans]
MIDQPEGAELLAVARRALLDTLLPSLPANHAYTALMIANAMAIAGRELQSACNPGYRASDAIQAFYQEIDLAEPPAADESGLAQLIRQRKISQAHQGRLHQLLLETTRMRLQVSNPKYFDH